MVRVTIVVFMLVHEQALVGFGLDHQNTPYMAAEISATSSACPVLKLPPGSALGNTSTITASGKIAIRYCLIPPGLTYWVANLRPPSSSAKPTGAGGNDHDDGIQRVAHQRRRGVAGGHQRRIRLTSRITTDRLRISEP